MKKLLFAVCLFTAVLIPNQSRASFLIDPYVGYNLAWDTVTQQAGGVSGELDMTRTGAMYGARVGYQFLGLMAGLEYGMGSGMTRELAAATIGGISLPESSLNYDASYMGVFVGYELPIMLRAWATYFFDASWDFDTAGKVDLTTIALGVGFTGLPFVSLNAEYRINTYEDADNFETNADILFSVSLPLNI